MYQSARCCLPHAERILGVVQAPPCSSRLNAFGGDAYLYGQEHFSFPFDRVGEAKGVAEVVGCVFVGTACEKIVETLGFFEDVVRR